MQIGFYVLQLIATTGNDFAPVVFTFRLSGFITFLNQLHLVAGKILCFLEPEFVASGKVGNGLPACFRSKWFFFFRSFRRNAVFELTARRLPRRQPKQQLHRLRATVRCAHPEDQAL